MDDVLLHNPQCSKSRAALEIVEDSGAALTVRPYLSEPLSVFELSDLVRILAVRPIEIVRRGEPRYAELGLSDDTPDEDVLVAISQNPILLERPILVRNGRAVIGRPPERVRDLLRS